jgi:FKBP-type peptidyl-prolyl cis-trans isomerase (trigger factor)
MQVTELAAEGLKRAFTVVVPATEIATARDQRLATLAKDIRLPGFRPGKVPMSVVKQRYGSAVMGEVLEEQVQSVTKTVIDERGLRPAMQPKIELVNFAEGADLEFKVELEQLPEIPLPDFAAIALEKPVAKVGDEEVTKALAGIASRNRAMEDVTEDRPAAVGDVVMADFSGRVKGAEQLLPPVAEGSEPAWKVSAAGGKATLAPAPGGADIHVTAGTGAARVAFTTATKVQAGEQFALSLTWQALGDAPVEGRNAAILFDMEDAAGKPLKTDRVEIDMAGAESAVVDASWTAPELEGLAAVKVSLRLELTDKNAEATLRVTHVSLLRGSDTLQEPFPGGTGTDMAVEIGGTGFIPGFAEGLDGIKVGETRHVDVVFPAEYGAAELAGKAAVFEITAKGLKKPVDAALDDDFAKKLGLTSLDELKQRITETLQQEYDQLSRMNVKRKLLDALSAQASFEVPEGMVEAEFAQIWQRVESDMKAGNLDADDKGKDEATLKADYRAIAERRIRLGLLLSEIGRSNNIQVANEELSRAMRTEAGRYPGQERQVMEFFQKNPQAIENLRAPLFEEKVVDFMLELAQVTEKEVPAAELSADPAA